MTIDLDVHAGENLAIIGPNGAGEDHLPQYGDWLPAAAGRKRPLSGG